MQYLLSPLYEHSRAESSQLRSPLSQDTAKPVLMETLATLPHRNLPVSMTTTTSIKGCLKTYPNIFQHFLINWTKQATEITGSTRNTPTLSFSCLFFSFSTTQNFQMPRSPRHRYGWPRPGHRSPASGARRPSSSWALVMMAAGTDRSQSSLNQ